MADGFEGFNTLSRYIGQTVTIYTTSGGQSGFGFTGVLMSVNDCYVRLLAKVGAAPDCALGSNCGFPPGRLGNYGGCGNGYGGYGGYGGYPGFGLGNGLGSVVVIPTDRIASFVHNAI